MSKEPKGQVNIHVSAEIRAVLEAARFARKQGSLNELVRPVIEDFAKKLLKDEAVKAALRAQEIHEASESGVLKPLRKPAKKR